MHYVPDPEERMKILARLRGNPWDGFFDANVADSLKNKYGFSPEFDLASRLSEALWRYRNRAKARLTPFSTSELESGCIESIQTAVHVGLWKANNQKEYALRSKTGSALAPARRFFSGKKPPGRMLDLRTVSLIRTLGAIYHDGTGKKVSLSHSPLYREYQGKAFRFLVEVCKAAGISIAETHIRQLEYRNFQRNRHSRK